MPWMLKHGSLWVTAVFPDGGHRRKGAKHSIHGDEGHQVKGVKSLWALWPLWDPL